MRRQQRRVHAVHAARGGVDERPAHQLRPADDERSSSGARAATAATVAGSLTSGVSISCAPSRVAASSKAHWPERSGSTGPGSVTTPTTSAPAAAASSRQSRPTTSKLTQTTRVTGYRSRARWSSVAGDHDLLDLRRAVDRLQHPRVRDQARQRRVVQPAVGAEHLAALERRAQRHVGAEALGVGGRARCPPACRAAPRRRAYSRRPGRDVGGDVGQRERMPCRSSIVPPKAARSRAWRSAMSSAASARARRRSPRCRRGRRRWRPSAAPKPGAGRREHLVGLHLARSSSAISPMGRKARRHLAVDPLVGDALALARRRRPSARRRCRARCPCGRRRGRRRPRRRATPRPCGRVTR